MESSGPEPEQLERDFPGWVAWTTTRRLWYAKHVKSQQTLSGDTSDELREKIQAHIDKGGL